MSTFTEQDSATLQELLLKTTEAIAAIDEHIAIAQAKIAAVQVQCETLQQDIDEHQSEEARQFAEQNAHVAALEKRLRQAQMVAMVAAGTTAATSADADVLHLQAELAEARKTAPAPKKPKPHHAEKDLARLREEMDQAKQDLGTLQERRQPIVATYRELHASLGMALARELTAVIQRQQETVEQAVSVLDQHKADLHASIASIQGQLSAWPELSEQLTQTFVPVKRRESEPPPTVQLIEAQIKYLELLAKHGREIETTNYTNQTRAIQLLSVPTNLIEAAKQSNGQHTVERWIYELSDYASQVEQQIKDRQFWRGQR